MSKSLLFISIVLFISFSACNYFESDNPSGISKIEVNISNLQPLPDTLVYVGWILTNADSSFKIFESNADQNGTIRISTNNEFNNLHKAQRFWITVEKTLSVPDSLGSGSNPVLQGRFTLGSAHLAISDEVDFSSMGIYSIATPTDTLDNDLSGVWFVDSLTRQGGPISGLNLPVLYGGWVYEGLVLVNGITLSTGTFTDPEGGDSFSGYSNTLAPGYNFPGEDFILNPPGGLTFPLDLSNALVSINFKLNIQNTSFSVKIFEAVIPANVQGNSTHQLQNVNAQIPNGVVTITVDIVE